MSVAPLRLLLRLVCARRGRRVLALCALAALPSTRARAETWKEFRTPYFTVLSAASHRVTLRWAAELNVFCSVVANHSKPDPLRPPLTVVIFADARGIAPFKPEGKPTTKYPAYFGTTTSAAFFLLTAQSDRNATRAAAYHRALHWITGADYRRDAPAWYVEGLAELYSTFRLSGDEIEIGEEPPTYGPLLRPDSFMSVRDLFNVSHEGAMAGEYMRDTVFYAESWLLVHDLLLDEPAWLAGLSRYYALRARKVPAAEAFQQGFGMSMAEMDQHLVALARRHGVNAFRGKIDLGAVERTIQAVPFVPADLERATGQAFLGMGHLPEAEAHLQRALAARPHDGPTLLSLAELAARRKDVAATRGWCAQVIAGDPSSAAAYYLRGRVLIAANTTSGGQTELTPVDARAACDDLMHTVALAPQWSDVIPMVAAVLPQARPRRDEDYAFLQSAATAWPPSDVALVALASLDEQAGHPDKAREEYDRVLAFDPPPSQPLRNYVDDRLSALERAAAQPSGAAVQNELTRLLEKKDYAKLAARLDELGASATAADEVLYERYRARMAAAQTLDRAAAALGSGDTDKAATILRDLLEQPHLDPDSQVQAREMLNEAKLQPKLPGEAPPTPTAAQ